MWASEVVREDLLRYGLLISEGKCTWGARRSIEWTGFVFDTCKFQLTVPEPKLARAAKAVEDMLERRHGLVLTKELASVAGLLGSFNLAMGSVTRFHTRGMMTKLVEVTKRWGWSGKLVLGERGRGRAQVLEGEHGGHERPQNEEGGQGDPHEDS